MSMKNKGIVMEDIIIFVGLPHDVEQSMRGFCEYMNKHALHRQVIGIWSDTEMFETAYWENGIPVKDFRCIRCTLEDGTMVGFYHADMKLGKGSNGWRFYDYLVRYCGGDIGQYESLGEVIELNAQALLFNNFTISEFVLDVPLDHDETSYTMDEVLLSFHHTKRLVLGSPGGFTTQLITIVRHDRVLSEDGVFVSKKDGSVKAFGEMLNYLSEVCKDRTDQRFFCRLGVHGTRCQGKLSIAEIEVLLHNALYMGVAYLQITEDVDGATWVAQGNVRIVTEVRVPPMIVQDNVKTVLSRLKTSRSGRAYKPYTQDLRHETFVVIADDTNEILAHGDNTWLGEYLLPVLHAKQSSFHIPRDKWRDVVYHGYLNVKVARFSDHMRRNVTLFHNTKRLEATQLGRPTGGYQTTGSLPVRGSDTKYPQSGTCIYRDTGVRAGDDSREHRRMGEIVVDFWRVLIAHISQTSKAIETQYSVNPYKEPFTTTEGNKEMAKVKTKPTSGSTTGGLETYSSREECAKALKEFIPKATRPMYEPLIDRLFCELPGARELVKPAATNTGELQSEAMFSQADALSVVIMGEYLQLSAAMRLKACASMAPADATELYGVPLKTFNDVFLLLRFVSNNKDDPEKTVVDWVGLRTYAAEQEAANATAAKNANLMTGMDGKSNYGHRFTR